MDGGGRGGREKSIKYNKRTQLLKISRVFSRKEISILHY